MWFPGDVLRRVFDGLVVGGTGTSYVGALLWWRDACGLRMGMSHRSCGYCKPQAKAGGFHRVVHLAV